MKTPKIFSDVLLTLSARSIRLNMLRSILSALGITIGVIAISAMGMLGANMTSVVSAQMSSMGNTMTVTPYTGGGGGGPPGMGSSDDDSYITEDQYDDIYQIASKYGTVYPLYSESDTITTKNDEEGRATIYGLEADDMQAVLTVDNGTFPRSESDVLVGTQLAERQDLEIGSKIKIGDEDEGQIKVRVSGILAETGLSSSLRTDSAIVMTEDLYTSFYGGEGEYTQVTILLDDINNSEVVSNALTGKLNKREDVISVSDSSSMASRITSSISTMVTFMQAIAAISLLVAAVSIFNVMMMSVTERISEIGILRSIGTQKDEVMKMFVYEASIIGLIGSTAGVILSFVVGYIVVAMLVGDTSYFFEWNSMMYLPIGMVIGTTICIVTGLYPAWRAANMDPVEALRAD
ncbi:MAG TPA: ABC transporter permease [Methanoregulaceae archaeon]|nr:ABC transporter permease [Methanoregulaceae archaeon]